VSQMTVYKWPIKVSLAAASVTSSWQQYHHDYVTLANITIVTVLVYISVPSHNHLCSSLATSMFTKFSDQCCSVYNHFVPQSSPVNKLT